jgi:hypothetical protein
VNTVSTDDGLRQIEAMMEQGMKRGHVSFGSLADISQCNRHVRFGSKADIRAAKSHVRFTPNSDIDCAFRHVR